MVTREVPLPLAPGRAAALLALLLPLLAVSPARAEEGRDTARLLLEAARTDLGLPRRLKACGQALRAEAPLDADLAVRAGVSLLAAAPRAASWLILRGCDSGWVAREVRAEARAGVERALAGAAEAGARAHLAAVGLCLGRRGPGAAEALTEVWPAPDLVRAVLRREIGHLRDPAGRRVLETDAAGVRAALAQALPVAALLDEAAEDEPASMRRGLDGLVALGARAVPLLLHEARQAAAGVARGRVPRAVRAIVALGFLRDRAATPVLARCLAAEDGWVRVAAANALGDLGDPAGAVALAVHCATLGDMFRARDQWDYPGASETTVPEADWPNVDYFVVDVAAADALLRLGVPGAAGYLIHEKLDPSRSNFRIRVFQDAVDALRRSVPLLDASVYNVDAGLPQRDAAFTKLAFRWHDLRGRDDLLRVRLDENDPGFRKAARELAERLRGTDVRTFMITKPACALLGRCMTPTLVETLAVAQRASACVALAETLGLVRDPRAVEPLLGLLRDERPFVRARAAEALGAYVADRPAVRDALLGLLADRKDGPRVSALKGLLAARRDPAVLAALNAHTPERASKDWRMAETALRLVQEGPKHWPAIEQGLRSEHRYEREAWWRLLRTALDWPEHLHDAKVAPAQWTPRVRRVHRAEVLARLETRRAR